MTKKYFHLSSSAVYNSSAKNAKSTYPKGVNSHMTKKKQHMTFQSNTCSFSPKNQLVILGFDLRHSLISVKVIEWPMTNRFGTFMRKTSYIPYFGMGSQTVR